MRTLIASIAGAVGGFILVVITGIVVLVIVLAVYKYQLRATGMYVSFHNCTLHPIQWNL